MTDFDIHQFMATGEAASALGVSPRTVRIYCERGILGGARQWIPGSSNWLIPRSAVVELLEGFEVDADLADSADSGEQDLPTTH